MLDLQALYSGTYKVVGSGWTAVILCRRGRIMPHSNGLLAAEVKTPQMVSMLAGMGLRLLYDYETSAAFEFSPDQFAAVANSLSPRLVGMRGVA